MLFRSLLACGGTGGVLGPVLRPVLVRALLLADELLALALALVAGLALRVALEACVRGVADLLSFGTPFGTRAASATGAGAPFQLSRLAQPLNPTTSAPPSAPVSSVSTARRSGSRTGLADALLAGNKLNKNNCL